MQLTKIEGTGIDRNALKESVDPILLREEGLLFHSMYDAIMISSDGTVPG